MEENPYKSPEKDESDKPTKRPRGILDWVLLALFLVILGLLFGLLI